MKQPKKTGKPQNAGLSRRQMSRQIKMLYDMLMETRQVLMNLTQRYEEMKIRMVSEWETIQQILVEEHGMLEESINEKLGENFTKNVDKYNKILEERMQEMMKQAEAQAEEVTKQAEEYLEKEGIELKVVDEEGAKVEVDDETLREAVE
jgi:ribosomal protein L15